MTLACVPLLILAIAGIIYACKTWFKSEEIDHDEEVEPVIRSPKKETGIYTFSKDRWN
jgi:hypothetical protein